MPQMGYDMEEGTVVRWLSQEGASVTTGQAIAEIETDKAVVEFESTATGILKKIVVPEGTTVPVGQAIAIVGEPDEDIAELENVSLIDSVELEENKVTDITESKPASASADETVSEPEPVKEEATNQEGILRASPVAQRLANEKGINLSLVKGTGPGGRITKKDVLSFTPSANITSSENDTDSKQDIEDVSTADIKEPVQIPPISDATTNTNIPVSKDTGDKLPLSRMRQQIARVTVQSKQQTPHYYVSTEINMTEAMDLRNQINSSLESEGVRISVNDLVIKACVDALNLHPKFNASFKEDGVLINSSINIGIAIAEEEGLIVPAIMECNNKSVKDISTASKDLVARSKGGTLRPQEYTEGTFSISNLGMFDVSSFIAIILPPQSAMLAVGSVAEQAIVKDGDVAVAKMMNATLSADHRVTDGAEGAKFILDIKQRLENPMTLVI
tara:strand:- start:2342 stop:3679 length:1338 start_codon:yes stop_codon:yes gene_type:complete